MQRIFIVMEDRSPDKDYNGNFEKVNEFMGDSGRVLSVTAQVVAGESNRGRWLVVADNGIENNVKL